MRQTHAASTSDPDPKLVARGVIDANAYMTLATADGDGRPWASPVWFAHHGYTNSYWVSRPDARHSRNLAIRPHLVVSASQIASARAVVGTVLHRGEQVDERWRQCIGPALNL